MWKSTLVLAALGSASVAATQETPQLPGKIVMYRPGSVMGFAVACPIRYKGQELVELGRGKYAEWVVPAGRYILTNRTSSVEVAVSLGEVRYVRCMMKPGFMTSRADLQIVDEESFGEVRTDLGAKPLDAPFQTSAGARLDLQEPRKIPAKTPSGYCLDATPDYVGTGASNMPAITSAMPRCSSLPPVR